VSKSNNVHEINARWHSIDDKQYYVFKSKINDFLISQGQHVSNTAAMHG